MKKEFKKDIEESYANEFNFTELQIDHLLSVLHELETFTGELELAVIKNGLERHELDKLIHQKIILK